MVPAVAVVRPVVAVPVALDAEVDAMQGEKCRGSKVSCY